MKLFFFFLFFAFSLAAGAQVDSTKIEISITLTKDQHKHVIRCLGVGAMTPSERRNYITDVLKAGYKTKADTAKITIKVPSRMVVDAFDAASSRPEGVVVNDNATTSAALFPQVQGYSWVLNSILAIKERNARRNQLEKAEVEAYMQELR